MGTIALGDDLLEGLRRHAQEGDQCAAELPREAVRRYLRELDTAKLRREQAAYQQRHESLCQTHGGSWVAFHQGQLVDADKNDLALHGRVRQSYGDAVVPHHPS